MAPVGAFTDGATPQALKVVVDRNTTPPPEKVEIKVIGRSVRGAMSTDPVPVRKPFRSVGGTIPEIRVAATPPAPVTLEPDSWVRSIPSAWLPPVMPSWSMPYGPLALTIETHLPLTLGAEAADTPS